MGQKPQAHLSQALLNAKELCRQICSLAVSQSCFPGSYFSYPKHKQESQTRFKPLLFFQGIWILWLFMLLLTPLQQWSQSLQSFTSILGSVTAQMPSSEFSFSSPSYYSSSICAHGYFLAGLLSRLLLQLCG